MLASGQEFGVLMQAGKLRHRVTLLEKSATQNSVGDEVITWAKRWDDWANVEPIKAREFLAPDGELAQVDTKITLRARWDIRPKMRLVWVDGGDFTHTYDILGVQRPGERNRDMYVICRENVSEVTEP